MGGHGGVGVGVLFALLVADAGEVVSVGSVQVGDEVEVDGRWRGHGGLPRGVCDRSIAERSTVVTLCWACRGVCRGLMCGGGGG